MSNKNEVYKILADVLGIDIGSINEKTGPDNVESWDSFNALMLINEFEEKFKISFAMKEVAKVENVGDIINILKKHGVEFS